MATQVTTPLEIPFPNAGEPELTVRGGAGRLEIGAGEDVPWVTGVYTGSARTTPRVEGGLQAVVDMGTGVDDLAGLLEVLPELHLALGTARPFSLRVVVGAGRADLSLGGLPLARLEVTAGAGPLRVAFSRPNPHVMRMLHLSVGAGRLEVHGLANAGFEQMVVEGGAAECLLDFTGEPARPGRVTLSAAIGRFELRLPDGLSAEVTASSLLGGATADPSFVSRPPLLLTAAAAEGIPPVFRIRGSTALGKLDLVAIRAA